MKVLSEKLQLKLLCECEHKFTKVFTEQQINTDQLDSESVKFVIAGCPQCKKIERIDLFTIKNE